MVIANREEWTYEILFTGDAKWIVEMETKLLVELDAKNDPMSFNQHNGDGIYSRAGIKDSDETRKKKSLAKKGPGSSMYGKKGELCPHYGKKHSKERKQKQSEGVKAYCKNRPKSHNENISKSLKGNPKLKARFTGENHPMYGIPASAHNKAMTKLKNSGDGNPMKKPEHQRICEHCNRSFHVGNYNRWHGDKCKHKRLDDE